MRTAVANYIGENDMLLDADNPVIVGLQGQLDIANSFIDWGDKETWFFGTDTTNESLVEDISWWFQMSPFDYLTWEKGQFLGKIQFLLDEQPLKKLIDVKAQWWTFGALSEKELALLTNSSSLLNSTADRNDDWQITWFSRMSESDMKMHLKILRDWYANALKKKTGKTVFNVTEFKKNLKSSVKTQDLSNSLWY
jgi:hypothetical protein